MKLPNGEGKVPIEDRTGYFYKWLENNFYNLLKATKVAYRDKVPDGYAPMIRPVDYDSDDPRKYSRSFYGHGGAGFDTTDAEEELISKGMDPRDILLLRAYKQFPGMVGK